MTKQARTLDEEIALYKKLNQTIYMIVSINRAKKRGDFITVELINKQLLANFEELTAVPYHSSLKEILEYKKRCEEYLLEKCDGDREKRSEVIYADNLEHLINQTEIDEEKFNLLSMFTTDSYGWWQTVLGSNLSLDKLSIMYIDILMWETYPGDFIKCTEMVDKTINDQIFGYINKTENLKNEIFKILIAKRPSLISLLAKKGNINFSYSTVDGKLGLPILWEKEGIKYFEEIKILYNGLSNEDKQKNIEWMLPKCHQLTTFNEVFELDFRVTKNMVDNITESVVRHIDLTAWDYNPDEYCNTIASLLIRKAHNKKEYKEYKKYVEEFLDKTDYKKILEERKQEKEKERQKELQLLDKREELSTLLYNLNEKLQEEVPGKTKIKNINFKK